MNDGMPRVNLRIPEGLLERIDEDVENGTFPNRSEALRYILGTYYDARVALEGDRPTYRQWRRRARSDGGRDPR